mgnify:CR=1 FL=1
MPAAPIKQAHRAGTCSAVLDAAEDPPTRAGTGADCTCPIAEAVLPRMPMHMHCDRCCVLLVRLHI